MRHNRRETTPKGSERAAKILARSFYQELTRGGLGSRDIMAVASELLGCLNDSMRASRG